MSSLILLLFKPILIIPFTDTYNGSFVLDDGVISRDMSNRSCVALSQPAISRHSVNSDDTFIADLNDCARMGMRSVEVPNSIADSTDDENHNETPT